MKQLVSWLCACVAPLSMVGVAGAQTPQFSGITPAAQQYAADVVRLDPALDAIVDAGAHTQMLNEEAFGLNEGPLWMPEGYLLFSDIAANVIYKWTPDNQLTIFLKNSGYTGDLSKVWMQDFIDGQGPLYTYNFGSNALTLDRQNRIVYVAQGDRAVIRLEHDGQRTVLVDHYQGKRLNRPNDLVVKSDGTIYFTDPRPNNNPTMELPTSAVFMIKNGQISKLINNFRIPNGLAFSPDEKYLYINDTLRDLIVRYEVNADDTLGNSQVFIDMSSDKAPGRPDGMKVDRAGDVYCTGPGGIWIMTPNGKHVGTIRTPLAATNLAFGDADYRTLYITDRRSLIRIRLKAAGIAPGSPQT